MRRIACNLGLALALVAVLVLPVGAADDPKKPEEKLTPAGMVRYKLADSKAGEFISVVQPASAPLKIPVAEDVKVRWLNPQNVVDEKTGKDRRPNAKELKEMKGSDPKLPGYNATFDDLKPNQIVTVYLGKKKGNNKPFVTMVVIEQQSR